MMGLKVHGSIGNAITFQDRNKGTMVRKKPFPTDRQSLAQLYQRWDYQDYVYQWRQLSAAEKQTWETNARRHRITGFNYFMSDRLLTLPDIVVRYRLDLQSGGIVRDFGKNELDATIYGAILTGGVIDNAFLFDGSDDYITPGLSALFNIPVFTVEFWYKWLAGTAPLVGLGASTNHPYFSPVETAAASLILMGSSNYCYWSHAPVNIKDGEWHFLHFLVTGSGQNDIDDFKLYTDTIEQNKGLPVKTGAQAAKDRLYLGQAGGYYHNACVDHFTIYNRLLDATERQNHYERRYPL